MLVSTCYNNVQLLSCTTDLKELHFKLACEMLHMIRSAASSLTYKYKKIECFAFKFYIQERMQLSQDGGSSHYWFGVQPSARVAEISKCYNLDKRSPPQWKDACSHPYYLPVYGIETICWRNTCLHLLRISWHFSLKLMFCLRAGHRLGSILLCELIPWHSKEKNI